MLEKDEYCLAYNEKCSIFFQAHGFPDSNIAQSDHEAFQT